MIYNKKLHKLRSYEFGGDCGTKSIKTICSRTKKKVGSADCEKTCKWFAGVDRKNKIVRCWLK